MQTYQNALPVVMNGLTSSSLKALLAKIGPSVLVLHSATGTAGYSVGQTDRSMVKAVVAAETAKCPKDSSSGVSPLASRPFLGIWGDHITKKCPGGHWGRRQSCQEMAAPIARTGRAPAQVLSLPDTGILGKSHMNRSTCSRRRSHRHRIRAASGLLPLAPFGESARLLPGRASVLQAPALDEELADPAAVLNGLVVVVLELGNHLDDRQP